MEIRANTLSALAVAVAAWAAPVASGAAAQTPLGTPVPGLPLGTPAEREGGPEAFAAHQLTFARVARARDDADDRLHALFSQKGVGYPPASIFLRVFKHERVMELWARAAGDSSFTLIRAYPVCALPGQLGPKRSMGDVQVPEGFYYIDAFNPNSAYLLSLRVSYPNLADRMRRDALSLGGDIFIHGGCKTVGCVPIENDNIEEVYWLAVQAMDRGQRIIPVHIFPTRMDSGRLGWLEHTFHPDPDVLDLWQDLARGYAYFQATHRVPWVTVGSDGRYVVPPAPGPAIADSAAVPAADSATASAAAGDAAFEPRVDTPAPSPSTDSAAPAFMDRGRRPGHGRKETVDGAGPMT